MEFKQAGSAFRARKLDLGHIFQPAILNRDFRLESTVGQFEILMASSPVDGVILSVAVLQAQRRISRDDAVCHGRSLGPLAKTRALRDDAL